MREIKFRFWDASRGSFIYYDLLAYHTDLLEVYKMPCQQYTGLKDKNGQEVYEGDMLTYDPESPGDVREYWPVTFEDGCFTVNNSAIWDWIDAKDGQSTGSLAALEVVGNIYEDEVKGDDRPGGARA